MTWFLQVALAIGLGYGLVEAGASQVLAHWHGSLTWKNGTSIQALLYSPIFYGAAFLVFCLPIILLSRILRRIPWDAGLLGLLVALSGYLLAMLMGHWFSSFAAIMIGLGLGTVAVRWYLGRRDGRALLLVRAAPVIIALALLTGVLAQVMNRVQEHMALSKLPRASGNPPNVLLLVLDTERGDHLTSYGYDRPTTPRLAELARDGVVFEWAMSAAPTTLPSHASMMTGRMVVEHKAGVGGRRYLDERYPTIAELLRDDGYATAGFVANIYWAARHTGLNRGFVHYEDFYGTVFDGITRTILGRALAYSLLPRLGWIDIPGRKRAETMNTELLDWLARAPDDRPYFAFVNYLDVHAPYLPPQGYWGRFAKSANYHTNRIEIGAWTEHDKLPPPEVLQEWRDRYDESLMYLDHEIGSLLDSLKARGKLEHTIVIVTSDHGESFGDHGMVHHGGSLYLEQIRVPLLLWGPGLVPQNRRVDHPVDLHSLPATIADVANLVQDTFPRHSLLQYLDSIPDSMAAAVSEGPEAPGNPKEWPTGRGWVTSLIEDHWHLLAMESGEYELYDIVQDPRELNNLATVPEHRELIERLRTRLQAAVPSAGALREGGEAQ